MKVFRAVISITLLLSAVAFAEEVTFNTGQTTGCFTSSTSCTQSTIATWDPSGASTDNKITFTGIDTANATTSGGSLNINLGTIQWGGSGWNIGSSENFYATVIFSLPTGIAGGQTEQFSADISGTWFFGLDSLTFNFQNNHNNPLAFTFNNGSATGSFQFYVDDVNLSSLGSTSATWQGHVINASQTPAATPEPGSIILMGSGLLTMAGALRRKLRR